MCYTGEAAGLEVQLSCGGNTVSLCLQRKAAPRAGYQQWERLRRQAGPALLRKIGFTMSMNPSNVLISGERFQRRLFWVSSQPRRS